MPNDDFVRQYLEDIIQDEIKILKNTYIRLQNHRQQLIDGGCCSHNYKQDFHWEFDNGYGKQTKHVGKQCTSCWFVDRYDNGNWVRS